MNTHSLKSYFVDSLGWADSPHSRHVFDFLIQAAHAAKGGVVLDAGAGHQRYKPFFSEAIYIAQEHPLSGIAAKNIVSYDILCDAKSIPLKANCVRVVLSTSSLEHMRDPEAFIKEAFRVLEPGGKLFIQVPFTFHEHEQPYDFQRPTSFGLQRWFEDAGFASSIIAPASSSLYTAIWATLIALDEREQCGFAGDESQRALAKDAFSAARRLLSHLRIYDIGPLKENCFPVGWTAIASKAGERIISDLNIEKSDILENWRLPNTYIVNGAIHVDEPPACR